MGSGTRLGLGWDAPQGHFTEGSISSENALAIAFDLVSGSDLSPSDLRYLAGAKPVEENKKALAKALADRIVAADQHIQNDMYGSRYEFNILSEYGYTDIALKAVTQTGLPGYVHRITQGTTSLWEQWTDRLPVNHHYRSNVATWFYQSLGKHQADLDRLRVAAHPPVHFLGGGQQPGPEGHAGHRSVARDAQPRQCLDRHGARQGVPGMASCGRTGGST